MDAGSRIATPIPLGEPPSPRLPDRVRFAIRTPHYSGTSRLIATLLDGAGLRVLECARLRVRDVTTTMTYTHGLNRGPAAVRSPADRLLVATPSTAAGFPPGRVSVSTKSAAAVGVFPGLDRTVYLQLGFESVHHRRSLPLCRYFFHTVLSNKKTCSGPRSAG